ncbi:MAG TPA: hypothetical protein VFC52_00805 [Solirubrobacterales bacterium]|nr:hypothetical protein [Solirubrobacterales bacterium]
MGARTEKSSDDPWRVNERVRRRRLREDGRRSLAENLAETIALSEFFATFAGSARKA